MASGSVQEIKSYLKTKVVKHFEGYGSFTGLVDRVDTRGKDDKPFHVTYDDGDAEWITLAELKKLKVAATTAAAAGAGTTAAAAGPASGGQQADTAGATPPKKKRGRPPKKAPAAASDTQKAAAEGKQPAGEAAAAPAKRPKTDKDQQKHTSKDAAPAAAGDASKRQQQPPAAAAAAATAAAGGGGACGGAGAAGQRKSAHTPAGAQKSTPVGAHTPASELHGLMADIHRTAHATGQQLEADRGITRLGFNGPGSTALPAMAMGVVAGGSCDVILYSAAPARSSVSPYSGAAAASAAAAAAAGPAAAAIDYKEQTEQLLAELEKRLVACNTNKDMLLKVTVYLRSMTDGLPGFKAAWNAWVDKARLPLLLLLEGSGPCSTSGIVLQATARSLSL